MKHSYLSRIFAATGLATLALTGVASGQDGKDQPAKPKIAIQKLEHSFGEIKKGSSAQHNFTVKNEGGADLEIKSVVPACGCTASDFTKIISPGKEGKITLIFNSAGFNGAVTKHAEVYTNDPERPQFTLMMSMIVVGEEAARGLKVGPFVVGPSNEWSSRAPQGSSVNGLITITNTAPEPINITKLDPNGTVFDASLQTLEEGKRYSVSFVSLATAPPGAHKQTLKLTTDSKETPEIELRLEVVVAPAVTVNPAGLTFNNLPVSTTESEASLVSKFLWVRSGRGGGLEIKSITSDLPFIKVKIESAEGGSITLRVGFGEKPPIGTHTGKIIIETNHPDAKILEAPITIHAK
ncbi:MAG TPA: DUF1573 domain-containing protein [Blastocatellia bacterium]|nr:DUF1573 domain-containing protein [Blastocatellia bacterium]